MHIFSPLSELFVQSILTSLIWLFQQYKVACINHKLPVLHNTLKFHSYFSLLVVKYFISVLLMYIIVGMTLTAIVFYILLLRMERQ
jgi:hypothetical protein